MWNNSRRELWGFSPRPRQSFDFPPVAANRNLAYGVAAAIALSLGVASAVWWLRPHGLGSATLLPQPRPLPALALVDQDGRPYTTDSLRGHWSLLFPGFTTCPDVCPTTLSLLHRLNQALGARAPQVVFLSVDPERDTAQKLKDYVHYFDPAFTAVTAPEPALAGAAQALGIAYMKVPGATDQDYTMDHSAALILIDPDAAIAGYFMPPLDLESMKSDLAAIMERRP